MLEPAPLLGGEGTGEAVFPNPARDWPEALVCSARKSFSVCRDDLVMLGLQQHYLLKEPLSPCHASGSSTSLALLVQRSVSGA